MRKDAVGGCALGGSIVPTIPVTRPKSSMSLCTNPVSQKMGCGDSFPFRTAAHREPSSSARWCSGSTTHSLSVTRVPPRYDVKPCVCSQDARSPLFVDLVVSSATTPNQAQVLSEARTVVQWHPGAAKSRRFNVWESRKQVCLTVSHRFSMSLADFTATVSC